MTDVHLYPAKIFISVDFPAPKGRQNTAYH